MKIVKRTDLIKLNENLTITVSDAISHLSKLPISFIEKHYANNTNKLSIKYYREMLIALMNDQVAYFQIMETTLASIMSHRLHYFKDFAVFQLEALLVKLANEENNLINEFYEDVWLVLLQVSNQLDLDDETLKEWILEAKKHEDTNHNLEEYIKGIHKIFKDENNLISGLLVDRFKVVVEESATDKEIREFASKHNIMLPKSLQKQQIYDTILTGLNNKYPKRIDQNIKRLVDLTIIELKRLAKDEDLDVLYEINKKGSIERLLEEYEFTNYQIPLAQPINLPPRIKVNNTNYIYQEKGGKEVNSNSGIEETNIAEVVHVNANEKSKVVYTNSGEPIHIHVYYDEVTNRERIDKSNIVTDYTKIEKWPLWLKILIFVLSLILATFILVIFLDITTLFPHEQSGFTRFVYKLIFPNS